MELQPAKNQGFQSHDNLAEDTITSSSDVTSEGLDAFDKTSIDLTKKSHSSFVGVSIFSATVVAGISLASWFYLQNGGSFTELRQSIDLVSNIQKNDSSTKLEELSSWRKFSSEEEYRTFLKDSQNQNSYFGGGFGVQSMVLESADVALGAPMAGVRNQAGVDTGQPDRYSGTNTQVQGIDEPDIVKTNGQEIYYSSNRYQVYFNAPTLREPVFEQELFVNPDESRIMPPQEQSEPSSLVIDAFPVSELGEIGEIPANGELLLHDQTLIVFENQQITGFDVSDPSQPNEIWSYKLDETTVSQARQQGDEIYVVLQKYNYGNQPCPMPLMSGTSSITVPCTDIFYSGSTGSSQTTYTVLKINADSGEVLDTLSFLGSQQYSTVYMSEDNLYISHSYSKPYQEYFFDFLKTQSPDLIPESLLATLNQMYELPISDQAKQVEFNVILNEYYDSLTSDARDLLQKELQNRLTDYSNANVRNLETTSIAKIDLETLEITSEGAVPGHPLNQFSLDEYQGDLRIAITAGGDWSSSAESLNDVYVLDSNLEVVGEALGMGLDERIYSVRFVGDKGYVVTFKQIDPFYVLDLSNPTSPEIKGELKIPGFSSYLHPLTESQILGVGRENQNVKLSLFDVADPTNPIETDVYQVNEYWTDVENNHHAFLHDPKHQIVFLPAGNNGLIFSYAQGRLELVRSVTELNAERAIFIDDNLYVIGQEGIVVLDQESWEEVGRLEF